MDSIRKKLDILIINDKTYSIDISISGEKNIHIRIKDMSTNAVFGKNFTYTKMKSLSPIFFNKNNIHSVFETILTKLEKQLFDIELLDDFMVFSLLFTQDEEKYKSQFKLKLVDNRRESFKIKPIDEFVFKKGTKEDIPIILNFVKELATYERALDEVTADENALLDSLFGQRAYAESIICYLSDEPVAFAVYFHNFSTWTGRPGIWLDDLYVTPKYRNKGIGKTLLAYLSKLAVIKNCPRFEWWVLNWNESSIEFYNTLGAVPMDEWTVYRLSGKNLEKLASKSLIQEELI